MRKRGEIFILYIYRKVKIAIEKKDSNSSRSQIYLILDKLGFAALTTVLLYALVIYINLGTLRLPEGVGLLEIPLVFLFLFFLFISHKKISNFAASKKFREIDSPLREILEVTFVIAVTFFLTLVINFIPLYFLFGVEAFVPIRVRSAFTLSIAVSLFFYYLVERERTNKELQKEMLNSARLQKENFEAQFQSLKSQVNPHFLFNSLNVLGSLIRQDKKRALKFKNRLADLYRALLAHGEHQLITLKQELEVARSYTYLLKTRFGSAILFEEEISPKSLELELPPGSLQMLLENAIKHNGSTKRKPLVVRISSEGDQLVVRNNLQPRLEKIESTKTGLKNISSRYKYLSGKEVEVDKTEEEFIVKLPLLKPHESSNY